MTSKDYNALAKIVGNALLGAFEDGGEEARTAQYENLYRPLVDYMQSDNPRFDTTRFAYAVATAESGV